MQQLAIRDIRGRYPEGRAVAWGMTNSLRRTTIALSLMALVSLAAGNSWAGKPEGESHGKGKKHAKEHRDDVRVGGYFEDRQRVAAADYYGKRRAAGHCPPGLAKKNNGCMPPGQAKKWQMGQPLPKAVVWYPVPREVVVLIGSPPPGYRYVRVLNDILLIATGTQMVVDAIEDLMRQ